MLEDKRENTRLNLGITVFHDGGYGRTKDISIDGTFIKRNKQSQSQLQPVGSGISLSFDFSSRVRYIKAHGVVVHHGKNDDGLGIWFREISERHKEFIRKFISDYS
ncbi:hypothetical protein DRO61_12160 [Candidatus Bathyarchaeota archaeon]|jgi:hypothetical protein|nr:MAG: hypothetical protein DRO61_12160 [Candidatus Bathyarchaeota archaeon]